MPILSVRHLTTYRYRHAVSFGEHRIMFRPRDSYDQRLIEAHLDVTPAPATTRWLHDVFGNCVALLTFDARARELHFDTRIRVEHLPDAGLFFELADYAQNYPFTYGFDEMPDLLRAIERHAPDPQREIDDWARRFLRTDGPTGTQNLLSDMTCAISDRFTYVKREEQGIQTPVATLRMGTGSCRDLALLMMEALRSLGLAAHFVSGYLHSPRSGQRRVGGGSTHAWVRVYLPGAGWVEYDPTNGIIGTRDLIRVAVARDPGQAVPLSGTWSGFPADSLGMDVDVQVTESAPEAADIASAPASAFATS